MIYNYFQRRPSQIIGDGRPHYFTRDEFESAFEAKEYNAIPYEPLYRVKITLANDGIWEKFEDGQEERRVWSAFGRHGGGWEMKTGRQFLVETDKQTENDHYAGWWHLDKKLFSGGYREEYGSFTENGIKHGSMLSLLEEFFEAHSGRGNSGDLKYGDKGSFQWKIPDDSIGGILYWKLINFEYTISVLIKSCENVYNGIKFWGVFWKDEEDKRKLYKPIEVVIPGEFHGILPAMTSHASRGHSEPYHLTSNDIDNLRDAFLRGASLQQTSLLRIFRHALNIDDDVARFLLLYLILDVITARGGRSNQRDIDAIIRSIHPDIDQSPDPRNPNVMETCYTRLRNEMNHRDVDHDATRLEISQRIHDFTNIVRAAIR